MTMTAGLYGHFARHKSVGKNVSNPTRVAAAHVFAGFSAGSFDVNQVSRESGTTLLFHCH